MSVATAITIDPEFRDLIPPLRPDERAGLEASIAAEGCRDPLVVWAGRGVLLDGHNRHAICERLGVTYDVVERECETREDAKLWLIRNQLCRRNLEDIDRIALARAAEAVIAAKAKANQKAAGGALCQKSDKAAQKVDTKVEAAAIAGVSHDTYAKGKAVLEKGGEALVKAVKAGDVSIHAASAIADLPPREQAEVVNRGPAAVREKAQAVRRQKARQRTMSKTMEAVEKARENPMPEPTAGGEADRVFLMGRPIRRVVSVAKFDADAVAHRIASEAIAKAWSEILSVVGGRTAAGMGPYLMALDAFRQTPGPSEWVVCARCNGTGSHGGPCSACNASGYRLRGL